MRDRSPRPDTRRRQTRGEPPRRWCRAASFPGPIQGASYVAQERISIRSGGVKEAGGQRGYGVPSSDGGTRPVTRIESEDEVGARRLVVSRSLSDFATPRMPFFPPWVC